MRALVSSSAFAAAIAVCAAAAPPGFAIAQPATDKKPAKSSTQTGDAAPVAIVEFGSGEELKWSDVKVPELSLVLTLESRSAKDISGLSLHLTPFRGAGESADVQVDKQAPPAAIEPIAPGASRTVTITATLPAAATYRSHLRLHHDGKLLTAGTIEIGRVRGAPPIEIHPIVARIVELDFWRTPVSQSFDTSIIGTGGTAILGAPLIKSREYRQDAAAAAGTAEAGLTITTQPAAQFAVGNQPVPLVTHVAGIAAPGRYDVTLAVGGPTYTSTAVPIVFYARQPKRVAAFWIFVGVALSFLLRFYGVVGRPVLLNRERVSKLLRELDEHAAAAKADDGALAVVRDIRLKLADHWNSLSGGGKLTDAAVLDVYDAKIAVLPVWIELRARVRGLEPKSVREVFEGELATAEEMLRNSAATLKAVADQVAILDRMPTRIATAVEAAIRAQLKVLAEQLPVQDDPRFADIQTQAAGIRAQLEAGRLDADGLDAAARSLERLQRDYIRIVADDLARTLTNKAVGVSDPEWASTVKTVSDEITRARKAATAIEASAAFQTGLELYLRVATGGLAAEATKRMRASLQHGPKFEPVKNMTDKVVPLINQGNHSKAWTLLNQAQAEYRKALAAATANLGDSDQSALNALSSLGGASAAGEFDALSIFSGIGGTISHRSAVSSPVWLRHAADILATVVILAAAVLLGVKTLWVGNLTWGGWGGYVGAFLWGFTFDQFTHAGLGALTKKG